MASEEDSSYYDEESENYISDDYDNYEEYEEEGEYYEEYDEYYEENGEYEEIEYEEDDEYYNEEYDDYGEYDNIENETLPDFEIPKVNQTQSNILIEDDPNDPRTWDEALRIYDESDSEEEGNHEELLKELKEAKIMENRKAILIDPFNLLKPRQIVERLNIYKQKKIQDIKDNNKDNKDNIDYSLKEKEIEEYIEKAFSPTGEYFKPEEYFAAIHGNASFEKLKTGAIFLKSNLQQNTIQLKQFVQNNIHRYVTCKDTIDVIGEQIEHNELSNDRGTGKLINLHKEIEDISYKLFTPLFEHKYKVEELRKKITLLEKYRYILNLPSSIQQSIENKEYDQILRDYKQTKEIRKNTNLHTFIPIIDRVEDIIIEYKQSLIESFYDDSILFIQHKKTMELLSQLGIDEHPFWLFLIKRKDTIINRFTNIINTISLESSITLSNNTEQSIQSTLQKLCKSFSSYIPDYYNLLCKYENEKDSFNDTRDPFNLLQELTSTFTLLLDDLVSESIPIQNKRKSTRRKSSKNEEYKINDNIENPHECLYSIISNYNIIIQNDSILQYLNNITLFVNKMIERFFEHAKKHMIKQITQINKQLITNQNIEPSTILSSVESVIIHYIELWEPILLLIDNDKYKLQVKFTVAGLECYLKYLKKLSTIHYEEESLLVFEARLLLLLEAIGSSVHSIQRFCSSCNDSIQNFESKCLEFKEDIIEKYCSSKIKVFTVLIDDIKWNKKTKNNDIEVQDSIMSILLQLVLDHAQIYGITPKNINILLIRLIEEIFSLLQNKIIKMKRKITKNTLLSDQIYVDIMFIKHILQHIKSKRITQYIRQILNTIQSQNTKDLNENIKIEIVRTKLLYQCFEIKQE